jgi:hypothetical protein
MTDSEVGKFLIACINYKSKIIQINQNMELRNSAKQNLSPLGFGTETERRQRKQVSG